MPDRITVKLEGGEELAQALQEIEANVKKVLKAATLAGGEVVAQVANGMAPGPHIEVAVDRVTTTSATVNIGPDKEHWYYQFLEQGVNAHEIRGTPLSFEGDEGWVRTAMVQHPGHAARPFLRPAHDETHAEQQDAMGAVLRVEIERVRAG